MIQPCVGAVGYFTMAAPSIADCNVSAATKFSVMATDDRTFTTACHLKWKHHLIWGLAKCDLVSAPALGHHNRLALSLKEVERDAALSDGFGGDGRPFLAKPVRNRPLGTLRRGFPLGERRRDLNKKKL